MVGSRRKWYNLILFVFGLILVLRDLYTVLFLGLSLTIIFIIIYGVCANLFYSLGWGVEILLKYYLDSPIEKYPRQFLYVLGLIFSLIITSVIFFRVVYIIGINF